MFAQCNFGIESLDGFAFASRKLPQSTRWLSVCEGSDLLYADPAPRPEKSLLSRPEAVDLHLNKMQDCRPGRAKALE
jgi:hypothetical protein